MQKLVHCNYVETVIPSVKDRKNMHFQYFGIVNDRQCFRKSSYLYAFVLMKCPFDRQCFTFAGHSDWQCHKSFQHDGIGGRNYKFPKFQ